MPRGHAAKREAKKPKKTKKVAVPSSVFADQEVQVIGKRRKTKEKEEEEA